jgi:hypothetical protein
LDQLLNGVKSGIPKDDRFVDDYLKKMANHNSLLIQWLENFRSQFGEYPQAQPTITRVEDALQQYKQLVGGAMAKVNIDKAIKARKPESVLVSI